MNTALTVLVASVVELAVLLGIGWLGLQIPPKPFPAYPEQTPALTTVDLPADLPAPVARYYKTIIGDRIPVIESAVVTGRGRLRVKGITFPARFRFHLYCWTKLSAVHRSGVFWFFSDESQ